MIPLFEQFSEIKIQVPYISIANIPTPVEKLDNLGKYIGIDDLYIKRDDLSGNLYGGNKIRKLEFLLGAALKANAKEVLTYGLAGSNHALATAIYGQKLGMKCIALLMSQSNARYVRSNLLLSSHFSSELHHYSNAFTAKIGSLYQCLRHKIKSGYFPFSIPFGGSTPLGIVGFVNAAFELKKQIDDKILPEPNFIYLPLGTTGTAVGLLIGLKAAGLKSRITAVRIIDEKFVPPRVFSSLFSKTISFLRSIDVSFPRVELSADDIKIENGFLGPGYARFTREGVEAIEIMKRLEGIQLDGTYSGKTAAAMISDAKNHRLKNKRVLFWNTYNSIDFSDTISTIDYHELPRGFHRYFEEELQPLDRRLLQSY